MGSIDRNVSQVAIYDEGYKDDFTQYGKRSIQSRSILDFIEDKVHSTPKKPHVLNNYAVEYRVGDKVHTYILNRDWIPVIEMIIEKLPEDRKVFFKAIISKAQLPKQNKSTEWLLEWNRKLEEHDKIPLVE